MNKNGKRTGPKLRTRYCALCGAKCEGAVVAANHCKGKGMRGVRVVKGEKGEKGKTKPDSRSFVGLSRGDNLSQ